MPYLQISFKNIKELKKVSTIFFLLRAIIGRAFTLCSQNKLTLSSIFPFIIYFFIKKFKIINNINLVGLVRESTKSFSARLFEFSY